MNLGLLETNSQENNSDFDLTWLDWLWNFWQLTNSLAWRKLHTKKRDWYSVSYCDRKTINLQTERNCNCWGDNYNCFFVLNNQSPYILFRDSKITQLPIQIPDNLTIPSNPVLILDSETWNSRGSMGFLWVSYLWLVEFQVGLGIVLSNHGVPFSDWWTSCGYVELDE